MDKVELSCGAGVMPPFGPISRANLIRGLRTLGFEGPYPGVATPIWSVASGVLPSQIRTKERLGSISWHASSVKLVLRVKNGKRRSRTVYPRVIVPRTQCIQNMRYS